MSGRTWRPRRPVESRVPPPYFVPFTDVHVDVACRRHLEALDEKIRSALAAASETTDLNALAEELVRSHRVELPELDLDLVATGEGRRRVPDRHFYGTARYAATVISRVPFRGDPHSLRCYADRITAGASGLADFSFEDDQLCFEFVREGMSAVEVTAERERNLDHLREHLPPVRRRLEIHNSTISARIRQRFSNNA